MLGQKQLSEYEGKGGIRFPYVESVSSLILRMGRGKVKEIDEPIEFMCSVCGKGKVVGMDAWVMVSMIIDAGGKNRRVSLCDVCMDVLSEAMRFGPRVIEEARTWELSTRVARVSAVHDELVCPKCMTRAESHVFVKFDDVRRDVFMMGSCSYGTIRVCARCAVSYLEMLRGSKVMKRNILKECCVEKKESSPWKVRANAKTA